MSRLQDISQDYASCVVVMFRCYCVMADSYFVEPGLSYACPSASEATLNIMAE